MGILSKGLCGVAKNGSRRLLLLVTLFNSTESRRFHERLYQLHIIVGNRIKPALGQLEGWQLMREELLKTTKAARGPALHKLGKSECGFHVERAKPSQAKLCWWRKLPMVPRSS